MLMDGAEHPHFFNKRGQAKKEGSCWHNEVHPFACSNV
ncbi:hypothetical protein EV682_1039 [Iodobacter fluviatilis]|uniref:Uncharacterized protein n=1 Tax=Iodobacter fluviatilis TaxID=537 RepID=A0A377Q9D9_9NEIS|nr:hypothetical protein EV682_1039 [Iodobacter fluviatilis]STQ91502.1 Uncharacterised protein [Iodobacter fluviatilis]